MNNSNWLPAKLATVATTGHTGDRRQPGGRLGHSNGLAITLPGSGFDATTNNLITADELRQGCGWKDTVTTDLTLLAIAG